MKIALFAFVALLCAAESGVCGVRQTGNDTYTATASAQSNWLGANWISGARADAAKEAAAFCQNRKLQMTVLRFDEQTGSHSSSLTFRCDTAH